MICSWCGSLQGIRLAEIHPNRPARICGEPSPFEHGVTCGLERGHMSACRARPDPVPTPLCFRCFGTFRESGERPPAYRMRTPRAGPNTGTPLQIARAMPRVQRR